VIKLETKLFQLYLVVFRGELVGGRGEAVFDEGGWQN